MPAKRAAIKRKWVDPDDAPELSDDLLERADLMKGRRLVRRGKRGRPPLGSEPKRQVTLRLDAEIIDRFRAGGRGWQSRLNAALRAYVEDKRSASSGNAQAQRGRPRSPPRNAGPRAKGR